MSWNHSLWLVNGRRGRHTSVQFTDTIRPDAAVVPELPQVRHLESNSNVAPSPRVPRIHERPAQRTYSSAEGVAGRVASSTATRGKHRLRPASYGYWP